MRLLMSTLAATIAAGLLAACSSKPGSPSAALPSTGGQGRFVSLRPLGKQDAGHVTSPASSLDSGWIQRDGVLYHTPHYMVTLPQARARPQIQPAITVSYGGGPVLVAPTVYLIFWGYTKYGDSHGVKPLLERYIGNMGGSSHNNIYTQYYEVSGGKKIYIKNPSNQYGGAWEDDTDPVPLHPTDDQIAAEALRAADHFGYNSNASYVVATPHGRSTAGFGTQFCAYHSATMFVQLLVSYTNLPYMPDAGVACGANSISPPSDEAAADEGVTIVEGHEQGESVTDPDPPTGWYNYPYGEIGDMCERMDVKNDQFHSFSYTMQPMFSNAAQSCVQSY
jgi:hypothetical protein